MEIIIVDSEAEVASIASDYLAHYANKGGNLGVATCLLYTSPSPRD